MLAAAAVCSVVMLVLCFSLTLTVNWNGCVEWRDGDGDGDGEDAAESEREG